MRQDEAMPRPRHLVDRQTFKLRRSAASAEWQFLMA